ncbi:MAG: energy transducer TonB [Mariprofundaceae bacterium]|nr:energy transducer TonB [Mariprofundaceae bacterium]
MSQSRFAKYEDYSTFSRLDFLFAALAHILVIIIIAIIAWGQSSHAPTPPLKRIEVSMISAQDLKKMQHKAHKTQQKKAKPIKKVHKPKIKKKAKPIKKIHKPKVKVKPKKKPVLKLEKQKKSPTIAKKVKEDPNFDPFAPIESSSNKPSKTRSKPKPDMADIMGKQLSTQEIDRYIAMMQAAVQSHWKVPGGINEKTPDPLVEMILQRNGQLLSVKILESSGNSTLDQTLIAAIRAAAPFNVPSKQFESFRNNRIRFHPL